VVCEADGKGVDTMDALGGSRRLCWLRASVKGVCSIHPLCHRRPECDIPLRLVVRGA
jgi:hypothetical protein